MHRLRYIMLSFAILCLTLLVASKTSFAQSQLKLGISVDIEGDNPSICRGDSVDIKSSISLILKQNKILTIEKGSPYIYVNLNVLEINEVACAVNLHLSLIAYRVMDGDYSGFKTKHGVDVVHLCDEGALLFYGKSKISKGIIDKVEIFTKRCLSSLDY